MRICKLGPGGTEGFAALGAPGINIERAGCDAVSLFESAGEIGGGSEAAGEGDGCERGFACVGHQADGFFEAAALGEIGGGFADDRLKDSVKVERGEHRDFREAVEADGLVHMRDDVIDGEVDPFEVCRGCWG